MAEPFHVLFVCRGNICRSPTAHGVFRELVRRAGLAARVQVASAATDDLHPGDPPDPRSVAFARRRGYDLSDLRARLLSAAALQSADLVLVMDPANADAVLARCTAAQRPKVRLLTDFCGRQRADSVPDPYDGEGADFERVLDLVEDACEGLLEHVRRRLGDGAG